MISVTQSFEARACLEPSVDIVPVNEPSTCVECLLVVFLSLVLMSGYNVHRYSFSLFPEFLPRDAVLTRDVTRSAADGSP